MNTEQTQPLSQLKTWYRRFPSTLAYIISIVLINNIFIYAPYITVQGSLISSGDIVVGAIYLLRDFVQREIKHYVILAMLAGCILSYLLADQQIALASVSAFIVGELIDWGIYTFSKKTFSERLLWSSLVSAPIDSLIFLYIAKMLNGPALIALTAGKFLGIFMLWYSWRHRNKAALLPA